MDVSDSEKVEKKLSIKSNLCHLKEEIIVDDQMLKSIKVHKEETSEKTFFYK